MLERQQIIKKVVNYLQTLHPVNAVWEGGAAAWKRIDEWSDIDLVADVNDEAVEGVMQASIVFLQNEFGIKLRFDVTQSPWPHIKQTFLLLQNTSPFLLIDFCIFPASSSDKFLERQIHGEPLVHFDKKGIVIPVDVSEEELIQKLLQRVPLLKKRFQIFQVLVEKELNRHNYIEAFGFYMGFTLQPLVEVLRIIHAPHHSAFGTRYIHYDLPKELQHVLTSLYFVPDGEALRERWVTAQMLFAEAVTEAERKLKTTHYV